MATQNIKIRGKAFWARVQEDNFDSYNGLDFYKITVVPDDASWDRFRKAQFLLTPKAVGDDNEEGITFRRNVEPKLFKNKTTGKIEELGGGPPKVVDDNDEPYDGLIGNGSIVEVTVAAFDLKMRKGRGHRLEKVKILDLVQYEPPVEDEEEDEPEEEKPASKPSGKRSRTPF